MRHFAPKFFLASLRLLRGRQSRSMLAVAGMLAACGVLSAQSTPSTKTILNRSVFGKTEKQNAETKTYSQAYVDFLLARELAEDNSRPEALQKLAESLRLQPQNNPAAALAFELIADQRARTRIVLRGHSGQIFYVGYSPDGTKIVTTSADHTARLWDAHTGRQLIPPLQHSGPVYTASFSPDGKKLATGSDDQTVRVWDAETGRAIGTPLDATAAVLNVQFAPDGKIVGAGSENGKAFFWNVDNGQPVFKPIQYHEAVNSIRFSQDGSRALIGTGDGIADVVDARTGLRLMKPLVHNNIVFSADFGPDDKTILTVSADFTARIWDAKTGQPAAPMIHHHGSIRSAALNRDGSRIVTASRDHTARVWDTRTGEPITPPLQHGDSVIYAIFSPDGNFVLTSAADRTVRLWDAKSGEPLRTPIHSPKDNSAIAFNPKGTSFLASRDSSVEEFDLPPLEAPPVWLADLAIFTATQNRYNQSVPSDFAGMNAIQAQLAAVKATDPWSVFGLWYFAEGAERPISPWSTVSLRQYVDQLITQGDKDYLDYAAVISYDHPDWMKRIAESRAKLKNNASDNMARSK